MGEVEGPAEEGCIVSRWEFRRTHGPSKLSLFGKYVDEPRPYLLSFTSSVSVARVIRAILHLKSCIELFRISSLEKKRGRLKGF